MRIGRVVEVVYLPRRGGVRRVPARGIPVRNWPVRKKERVPARREEERDAPLR